MKIMKVYELNWKRTHLVDEDEDCSVVEFDGIEDFRFQLGGIEELRATNPIILQGNFNVIPYHTDFPVVDIGLPLMSKKMISVLDSDETLFLNKIKTIIVDDTYLEPLFDNDKKLRSNIPVNEEYQFIQILNYLDAFDRENSVFRPLRSNPDKIGVINKLVLKEPLSGFPAIFRIEEKPSMIFINEITKLGFEQSDIKGCAFKEVEVTAGDRLNYY